MCCLYLFIFILRDSIQTCAYEEFPFSWIWRQFHILALIFEWWKASMFKIDITFEIDLLLLTLTYIFFILLSFWLQLFLLYILIFSEITSYKWTNVFSLYFMYIYIEILFLICDWFYVFKKFMDLWCQIDDCEKIIKDLTIYFIYDPTIMIQT